MDNQKIILLTHEYPPKRGGAGVYCEELVHASQKLDIPVEAWVPEYSAESEYVRNIPIKGTQSWFCSYRLFKEIWNNQNLFSSSTLLHFAEPGSLRALVRFAWFIKNLPAFIVTIHGTELIRFCKNPIEKILFKKVLKKAKRIHVLSNFNQIELLKICPEVKDNVFLHPGAPARNLVSRDICTKSSTGNEVRILCVARIHPRKGQDLVLKTIQNLPKVLKYNIECLFVGPIVNKRFYEKIQKQGTKTGCKVSFLGDLPDNELKEIYQSSHIFILPSMPRANSIEGFGFVYLEASSHGLPILAHRIGGVEDAVQDGITGTLTNSQNPSELRDALQHLLENKSLRIKMGKEGRTWSQKHNWKSLAEEIYKIKP